LFALLFLALIAQSAMLYPRLRVKNSEIATLRNAVETANQTLSERTASTQASAQADELTRLRKDNQELHRLRNEVRELREASQQTAKAAQAAPATSAGSTELVAQLQRQVQQLQAENLQLRAAQQLALTEAQVQVRTQLAQIGPCINNLRQIDGAKQQWALENRQTVEALPEVADIEPYLGNPTTLLCPAGGTYTLNAVGVPPTCTTPGHVLPQ
jgi:uncharacterized coiled-coil DUF342 family protein